MVEAKQTVRNNASVSYEISANTNNKTDYQLGTESQTTSVYISTQKEITLGVEGSVCGACDYLSCSCPTLDDKATDLSTIVRTFLADKA